MTFGLQFGERNFIVNTTKPMMKCGHAANATNSQGKPSCVICVGIHAGAEEIDGFPPVLKDRLARCVYYGKLTRKCESNYGSKPNSLCDAEETSHPNLPFFEYKKDKEVDSFYCGCHGWD